MEKSSGSRALKIVAYLMLFIALIHGFTHIVLFETNLSLVKTVGLSGFAIGDVDSEKFEQNIKQSEQAPKNSLYIIGAEWLMLVSLMTISILRSKIAATAQNVEHFDIIKKRGKSETDIDVLYQLLQKNKKITVTKAAELFNVEHKVVEEWGEVLENNSLAVVDYPRFGEIEIRLKE